MSASKRSATPPRLAGAVELSGVPPLPALGGALGSPSGAKQPTPDDALNAAIASLERETGAGPPSAVPANI
eukprot:14729594-Alexandrium_andersonii.AAC.1